MPVLHLAAQNGHVYIVKYLLDCKAKIDARNAQGETVFDIAMRLEDKTKGKEIIRILLENSEWRSLMKPTDRAPLGRHPFIRNTPFRQLVKNFPELVDIVLDECITKRNDPANPFNFFVEYDFRYLDDTYLMPEKDGNGLTSTETLYDEYLGNLNKEARSYTENYDLIAQNHLLREMEKSKFNVQLLSHPLTKTLIKYKWNNLGRYIYYTAFSIYILYITLFTLFITYSTAPYHVPSNNATHTFVDLSYKLWEYDATCSDVYLEHDKQVHVKWLIVILAICQLCKEGFQFYKRRLAYLSIENGIEIFIYISTIFIVFDISDCSHRTGIRLNVQWILAAVCSFVAWLNLLLLIRKLPRFGIYVVMFFDILSTFSRFVIIFALFIFAFSISFFIMMQNRSEFSSLTDSILKTTVMMIGEFEFVSIFHGDTVNHSEKLYGPPWAKSIFLLFCIVMTILLMNLLVGLAVDDIKGVQEEAELQRLAMMVDTVLQIEASMPPFIRRLSHIGIYRFFPNQDNWWKRIVRRFGYSPAQKTDIDEDQYLDIEDAKDELRDDFRRQEKAIDLMQRNIDIINDKQTKLEKMLDLIIKEMKIQYNETD
ncbi:hypothetical protein WR25_06774 isoform A [Diploscapter pachys]|uniref:Ion transport domain-containing protein n=1 Tax=Diploscapter pachys TaxID=2018661 RepID=A0A2A2J3T7_9BILA|nr:hypothetical protein WR25_06774 isoform A [Diploscapter pachys]